MGSFTRIIAAFSAILALAACSPVAGNIREQADAGIDFESLQQDIRGRIGEPVVLGGYILETENLEGITRILVLQTPLGFRDRPGDKDLSRGRFMAVYDGFLDPEVYQKDREVTITGTVSGLETVRVEKYPYPLVRIDVAKIHLWRELAEYPVYPYPPYRLHYRFGGYGWPYW